METLGALLGTLGSLLGGFGGPRGPEGQRTRAPGGPGENSFNPPRGFADFDPPLDRNMRTKGRGKLDYGTRKSAQRTSRTTGKREESGPKGRWKREEEGYRARPEAQGAGGFVKAS